MAQAYALNEQMNQLLLDRASIDLGGKRRDLAIREQLGPGDLVRLPLVRGIE